MRRLSFAVFASALLLAPATPTLARSDNSINAEISAFVLNHPKDFVGLDKLAFKYTGKHIAVAIAGVDGELTAVEAQAAFAAQDAAAPASIVSTLGIPNFGVWVTSVALSGGGWQFWGTWDFPDAWAGQDAPVDLAQLSFQMNPCMRMSNYAIWTYAVTTPPGSTNLGTLRSTAGFTGGLWNVADRTSGFQNLADRGTTRIEVRRGTGCPGGALQIAAAFDYESNQGGGVLSVSPSFAFFSVQYSGSPLTNHQGTPPIYVNN